MTDQAPMELSIVAPMYNEEENVERTVRLVQEAMCGFDKPWELVVVNDGSTDRSWEKARSVADGSPFLRVCGYGVNRGRGHALRVGFSNARGQYVVAIDFDLSYDASHIRRLYEALTDSPDVDIVLGSAYMPGGEVCGVHWKRLLVSRLGNMVLRRFLPVPVYTSTCVLRGYRREALAALPLHSDGKELHLEILSKAAALGLRVVEVPARLESRKKGRTKSRIARTSASHLLFCLAERPVLLFKWLGLLLACLGLTGALVAIYRFCYGTLDLNGPLIPLVALALLGAVLALLGGVLALLLMEARSERVRIESELIQLRAALEERLADAAMREPEGTTSKE